MIEWDKLILSVTKRSRPQLTIDGTTKCYNHSYQTQTHKGWLLLFKMWHSHNLLIENIGIKPTILSFRYDNMKLITLIYESSIMTKSDQILCKRRTLYKMSLHH